MKEDKSFITIGKIVNTQGHRGEVRVIPLTDYPERFSETRKVFLKRSGRDNELAVYQIEKSYAHKKFIILKFLGVNDMNAGEELKGSLLLIPKEELMPLPEDTFYIFDIVGMEVYTTSGRELGQVKDVLQTAANDVYIVEGSSGGRPLLIPALKKVVHNINLKEKKMIVELPEGLEE